MDSIIRIEAYFLFLCVRAPLSSNPEEFGEALYVAGKFPTPTAAEMWRDEFSREVVKHNAEILCSWVKPVWPSAVRKNIDFIIGSPGDKPSEAATVLDSFSPDPERRRVGSWIAHACTD